MSSIWAPGAAVWRRVGELSMGLHHVVVGSMATDGGVVLGHSWPSSVDNPQEECVVGDLGGCAGATKPVSRVGRRDVCWPGRMVQSRMPGKAGMRAVVAGWVLGRAGDDPEACT